MSDQQFAPGTFCWWDLSTTTQDGANEFYTALFSWELFKAPVGPDEYYSMFMYDGKTVCGGYVMRPEQLAQGVPPYWMCYVGSDDVDATAAKVAPAGGVLLAPPFDVMEAGRMAIAQDPTGAVFGIWQPKEHQGAGHLNAVNGFSWNELVTKDSDAAGAFYSAVFGWTIAPPGIEGMTDYTIFKQGETMIGGMMRITEAWGDIPPHWMPYVQVAECDATVEKAKGLGASAIVEPQDIPTVGRFAVLRDPQGAAISVITFLPMPS